MRMGDVRDQRSLAWQVHGLASGVADHFTPGSLFEKLMTEKIGIAFRDGEGRLQGKGQFVVFYAPHVEWGKAEQDETIGRWIYGEWGDRQVAKALDNGGLIEGSRVVLANGTAKRTGNSTAILISRLAVGLVEESLTGMSAVHFLGAVNMLGLKRVDGFCSEEVFHSDITGFITNCGDKAISSFYPLKGKGRS